MGNIKDLLSDDDGRGWSSPGKKFVCGRCFNDEALARLASEYAEAKRCDYCGRKSRREIAAPIDLILSEIDEGLRTVWAHADDEGVPYETGEGGYQGKVLDSWNLFNNELENPFENEQLSKDVVNSFVDTPWCQRHFFSLTPEDVLKYGWEGFTGLVKHETRYLFLVAPDQNAKFRDPEEVPPSAFLERLGSLVAENGLIKTVPKETRLFRARVHDRKQSFSTAEELGTPSVEAARYSNRMSPAGIPMFYGSFDAKTAFSETFDPSFHKGRAITIGEFQVARDIFVLDLTDLPEVPSLFDSTERNKRPALIFLNAFVRDLAKPIQRDGREHIDYVPTQIVTEYFRRVYEYRSGDDLHGILYNSSKTDGRCCVLFFLREHCCDISPGWMDAMRSSSPDEFKWWLGLDPSRVKRKRS